MDEQQGPRSDSRDEMLGREGRQVETETDALSARPAVRTEIEEQDVESRSMVRTGQVRRCA
jgi:hypothetical protein